MIKILNKPLFSLICLVLSIGLLTSCEKDKDGGSGQVELLSFGPTGASHGDTLSFIGNNLDKVTSVELTGVSVPKSSFIEQTDELILIIVPDQALQGLVKLKADNLEVVSKTALNLNVLSTITSFTEEAPSGAEITINGTHLQWVTRVTFFNNKVVDSFVSKSFDKLVIKVPEDAETGKLILSVGGTEPVDIETESAFKVTLPAIAAMSPNPVDPGANVTITGTNLDLVDSITFNNAPAVGSFVSQSATEIVVEVPMGVASGFITLGVQNSVWSVQSPDVLQITGEAPPPVMSLPIYDDAVTSNWTSTGWIGGGWGGTKDFENASPVRAGTKSVKISYDGGYGSPLQLGGASVDISSYTTFKVSIYGAPGSAGKKVNIGINGADKYDIILVEGKWTDYSIPLSSLTSTSTLSEILIKEYNGSGGFSIYVDALGLN